MRRPHTLWIMHTVAIASVLALTLLFAGCQSTDCCSAPAAAVAEVAAANADVTRLSLHCRQDDGSVQCCASTDAARVGTASAPEDLRVMAAGETVVLDEDGAFDVTVPLLETDGKWTTVCGVTVRGDGISREQAIARANEVAAAVGTALGGTCCNGGACCK